jgi:5-formyltetrahydrofolate cyclo-ligase
MKPKNILRKTIRDQRKQLSPEKQQQASQQLSNHFSQETIFLESLHIAFYIAHEGEIDPKFLLESALQKNKICYLPGLDPTQKNLFFIQYKTGDKLILNRYKIPEPEFVSTNIIQADQLDLVLLPLVAFDKKGNRLGMGAGFYDRTFHFLLEKKQDHKPKLIGLAYEFQSVENLEPDEWDIPLDGIATEKKIELF